jgi:hypothetical protein
MTDPTPDVHEFERLMGTYTEALEAGRTEDAEAALMEFFALVAQHTPDEPSPELELLDEAARCEGAADWGGAEATYRKLLALAEKEDNAAMQYRAHESLARLNGLLGQHGAALDEARAAVAAARRADLAPLLCMALDGQAVSALRTDRVPEALAAVCEALERTEDGALFAPQRGRALALRAACRVVLGEWPAAEADLAASWAALQTQAAMVFAAGVQSALVRWWAVTARLRGGTGDVGGAVEGWREAVALGRHVAALPQVAGPHVQSALARMLLDLGRSLATQGSPHLAEEAFAESRSLRQAVGLSPFGPDEPTL